MDTITVNELMVVMHTVRDRMHDLKELRLRVSTTERYFGNVESTKEPEYDVKLVDKKITELQNFIVRADMKIKMSNSKTLIDLDVDVDGLLEPLTQRYPPGGLITQSWNMHDSILYCCQVVRLCVLTKNIVADCY